MTPDMNATIDPDATAQRIDFFNLAARRKPGIPADFVWCNIEVLDDGQDLLTGCAQPTATYKSGKRKGRTKWPPDADLMRVVVSRAEFAVEQTRWETETGRCSKCYGRGQTVRSCSATETTYRTCSRCKGTGAKLETPAP